MSMSSSRPYITRALYDWIIVNDCTPHILVNSEKEGVVVPVEYVENGQIVLNIAQLAVDALDIGNDVLTFDGSFGGVALTIVVPFDALMAIYAKENGQGMVFEIEDSLASGGSGDADVGLADKPLKKSESQKTGRPSLKVVK